MALDMPGTVILQDKWNHRSQGVLLKPGVVGSESSPVLACRVRLHSREVVISDD